MPPRFAYWTILIDNAPTAFRARDREELLPTLAQLKRTNQRVALKWFAQGRLWDSREAQHASWKQPKAVGERRDRDWRPGGQHKDPRARFDKEAQRRKKREQRDRFNASSPGQPRGNAPSHGDTRPNVDRRSNERARTKGAAWKSRAARTHSGWRPKPRHHQKPWPPNTPGGRRKRRDDEPPDRD